MDYDNVQIISVGHSGSSLLNLILGAHSEVFSAGEVFWLQRAISKTDCACGLPASECKFWNVVTDRYFFSTKSNPGDWEKTAPLRDGALIPRKRGIDIRFVDPMIIFSGRISDRFFRAANPSYRKTLTCAKNNNLLLDIIQDTSKCRVIVDSSKNPVRLKAMALDRMNNLKVIHIVRDGRAVSRSWVKAYRYSFGAAVQQWHLRERLNQLCLSKLPDDMIFRIKYEDLCEESNFTLSKLCEFLQIPFDPTMIDYCGKQRHDFHINPRPLKQQTEIRLDDKWKTELSSAQLEYFQKKAGKLNRQLGYE